MAGYTISSVAKQDMKAILEWTEEHFGQQARLRYQALLTQAILDLAEDCDRIGAESRSEIATAARTYHLWHSRNRVESATGKVKHPRHFLLFRLSSGGRIEIGRVLHDSVDLAKHLPTDYLD